MRYNVHSPCAFHNRIARYLGVLVAAALIATLGLPSAAQAQTPAAPTVTGDGRRQGTGGGPTITATWGVDNWIVTMTVERSSGGARWKVEYTEPGVPWDDAKALDPERHDGTLRLRYHGE